MIKRIMGFDPYWFGFGTDLFKVWGVHCKWFNCFSRLMEDGHYWGFGFLQVGGRHLIYFGSAGFSIFWYQKLDHRA